MATNRCGLGSGTPTQELERWLKDAGKVRVFDEGEQHQLFDSRPTRVYRLFNKRGESLTISAETAHRYGLRPATQRLAPPKSSNLFDSPQGFMFGEEV
jgi:hypothetical protein